MSGPGRVDLAFHLWQTLFPHLSSVGAHQSFEESGGDSLKAIQLNALLHLQGGVYLSAADFRAGVTLETLRQRLAARPDPVVGPDAVDRAVTAARPDPVVGPDAVDRAVTATRSVTVIDASPTDASEALLLCATRSWAEATNARVLVGGVGCILGELDGTVPLVWMAYGLNEHHGPLMLELARHRPVIALPTGLRLLEATASGLSALLERYARLFVARGIRRVAIAGECHAGNVGVDLAHALRQAGLVEVSHVYVLEAWGSAEALKVGRQLWRLDNFRAMDGRQRVAKVLEVLRRAGRAPDESGASRPLVPVRWVPYPGAGTLLLAEGTLRHGWIVRHHGWSAHGQDRWRRVRLFGHHGTYLQADFPKNRATIVSTLARDPLP